MIGAIGINRDISARVIANERLLMQAHFDNLTKIPNRYLVLDRLYHLIQQSERNNQIFALLFVDVDNLKK
jgi:GGDEF domain-containing protein